MSLILIILSAVIVMAFIEIQLGKSGWIGIRQNSRSVREVIKSSVVRARNLNIRGKVMCSSPKSSASRRCQKKHNEYSRSEYEEYATMVERASAVFERIEHEKSEKKLLMASQESVLSTEQEAVLVSRDKVNSNMFSKIKAFLLRSVL